MGEEKSVLRWGGIAGILTGITVIAAFIVLATLAPPPTIPPDYEQTIMNLLDNPTPLAVTLSLGLVALLLILPFLAALYWSLREPSRVFARIGLGSSVLATVLLIIWVTASLQANIVFPALYDRSAPEDQPLAVAAFAVVQTLAVAAEAAGLYLLGLAFVAFGGAMRANPGYPEGFVWLSAGLGIIIVLLPLLNVGSVGLILVAVLGLALGWKIYSLSRAA